MSNRKDKKSGIRKLLTFILACVLLVTTAMPAFAAPSNANAEKTVRLGYFEFGGMFEGASSDERKSGYCYEYMMQIAVYTGWNYEFCYGSYSELYEMLKNGEIDVLPYTNYNDQRGQEVLFSDRMLAEEEYYIAVKPDSAMDSGGTDALNGAVISTLKGADYNDLLLEYIEANDLDMEILYYTNLNETWDALRNGKADATVFTSNAYSDDGWKCICSFGKKPTYVAVSQDREDLLAEFNEAAELIDMESPALLGDLYAKYFSDNPMRQSLSQEEQGWLDDHPVIHVGCFTNDAPYVFSVDEATGAVTGLTPDVMSGIFDRLHVSATADYKCYDTFGEMEAALNSGEIDVIAPFYPNHYIAQQHNLVVSNTVRVSNMELVYLAGTPYNEALSVIATPSTRLGIYYVQDCYPDSEIIGAASVQDAVDKVRRGEAKGAIAQNVVLHNIKEKYDDLNYLVLAEGCGTCFAARPENHALIRILNRGLNYFSGAEISAIASQYSLAPNVTTKAFLATHKEARIMLITILVIFLALVFAMLQLTRLRKKADEANRSKTAFLFSMSHDIRTPMNAILGYTDIGLRHVEDVERSKDSYKKIKTAGGHLLNLINDILEMSRIESGKMGLAEEPVDIREAIAGIDHMSRALAIPKSIDYETVMGDIKNPYVLADELHMNEVVINLISNAVKYTPEDGRVSFHVSQISDVIDGKVMYRFEVSDNGIGMSEDFQRHLFEAFSREETATVSKIEGSGLGLSIVKKIVDMAGGSISVKSRMKEGSTFTLEIPLRVMDNEAIRKFKSEKKADVHIAEDIVLEGKKVLLVEDNEMNREIATDILQESGLEVDEAENGEAAVRTILDKGITYYDFVLMDIQMPVMNGYEATKAIRALPGSEWLPIIALSANAFEEDKQKSMECGMNAHIAKPIDVKTLIATMHSLL